MAKPITLSIIIDPSVANPRRSMYGIVTHIYPINDPHVGKYTIHGSSGNCCSFDDGIDGYGLQYGQLVFPDSDESLQDTTQPAWRNSRLPCFLPMYVYRCYLMIST